MAEQVDMRAVRRAILGGGDKAKKAPSKTLVDRANQPEKKASESERAKNPVVLSKTDQTKRQNQETNRQKQVDSISEDINPARTQVVATPYGQWEYQPTPQEWRRMQGNSEYRRQILERERNKAISEAQKSGLQPKKGASTNNPYEADPNASKSVDDLTFENLKLIENAAQSGLGIGAPRAAAQSAIDTVQQYSARAESPFAQIVSGLLAGVGQQALNPMATFAKSTGNAFDPNATAEERLGAIGNMGLYALDALPLAAQMGKAGAKTLVDEAFSGLKPNDVMQAAPRASFDVPTFKNIANDLIGVKRVVDPTARNVGNSMEFQMRTPVDRKAPDIDPYSKPAIALEKYAESNIQDLNPAAPTFNLRIADAVGKHLGAGAVDRANPAEWYKTLQRKLDDSYAFRERMYDKDLYAGIGDLRETLDSKIVPAEVFGQYRKTFDKSAQSFTPTRAANVKFVRLEDIPPQYRKMLLDMVQDDDFVYITQKDFNYWKSAGKSKGLIKPKRLTDLANYTGDVADLTGPMSKSDVFIPRKLIRELVRDLSNDYRNAAKIEAAYGQKVTPDDLELGVKHYLGEVNINDLPKPVRGKQPVPETAQPVQSVQAATPPKNPFTQIADDLTASSRPAGVSNNIELSKVEQGIIKESPVGKGLTNAEFQARISEAGRKIDSGEVNPVAVADAVAKGKALDTDSLSVISAANRRLEQSTINLTKQLDSAIESGDNALIESLQKQVDDSRQTHLDFLEKVQKGKSEWSNVGRLMAQGMDVDSDTLTGVVANAQRISGKKFGDIEQAAKLEAIGKQLEEANAKLDGLTAENLRLNKLIQDGKAPGFRRAATQVRREKAISNIKTKWQEYKPEAKISSDPFMAGRTVDELRRLAQIAPDVVELAKTYIADGVEAVSDILKRVKQDTDVDLSEDDFNLILSGEYNQFKTPKTYEFDDIQKEFQKMVVNEKVSELRRTARNLPFAQRARINKSIKRLENQIKNQQLPNARAKTELDESVKDAIIKRESLRIQRDDIMRQLKDQRERELNPGKTLALELVNAPKSLVLSLDNSAPLTHGAFVAGSHPIIWAKATGKSLQAFFSESNRVNILAELRADPYFDKAVASGVKGIAMRDLRDAAPYSGIVGRIPILGKPFLASDRAMEVFGAKVRMDLFKAFAKAEESGWLNRFVKSKPDYKAIAEAVNTMTGKGAGKVADSLSGDVPAALLTAPTYTVSRFKLAMGTPALNAAIRKQPVLAARIVADYAKFAGTAIAGLEIAKRLGAEVNYDDKSSDYLKFKLPGSSVWIDPMGGILQPVRLALKMRPSAKQDPKITAMFFVAGKAAPIPRSILNVHSGLRGKKEFGKSYDPDTPEGRMNLMLQFAPLSTQNAKEILDESGLRPEQKSALILASFFGANVNVKNATDKK